MICLDNISPLKHIKFIFLRVGFTKFLKNGVPGNFIEFHENSKFSKSRYTEKKLRPQQKLWQYSCKTLPQYCQRFFAGPLFDQFWPIYGNFFFQCITLFGWPPEIENVACRRLFLQRTANVSEKFVSFLPWKKQNKIGPQIRPGRGCQPNFLCLLTF